MALAVLTTGSFDCVVKKLHPKDKKVLDAAVVEIMDSPFVGVEKRGDSAGVFVFKFKLNSQETLLAYKLQPDKKNPTELVLMSVGPHANFCNQLKRSV